VAALGVVLLATAALFGAAPLYVAGLALVLLAALSALWMALVARGLGVRRSLEAHRVVEGEALTVVLDVRCGRLPLPPGRVRDRELGLDEALPAGRARARLHTQVRFSRRGLRSPGPVHVTVRDPLGLAVRELEVTERTGEEVLVLPSVHPVVSSRDGARGQRRRVGARTADAAAATDLDGVGALQEGTPASRIFWPSVARGGAPLERRMVAEGDGRPLVVLDPRGGVDEEAVDAAVRATASLAVALARAGGCAVLLPGDRRPTLLEPSLSAWPHLHARLAVVGATAAPRRGAAGGRRGIVIHVVARPVARPPRSAGSGRSTAAALLVIPGVPPPAAPCGARVAFTVAGCTGYDLTARRPAPGRAPRETVA
jgi:uncharacterized protein (DUF58 family)